MIDNDADTTAKLMKMGLAFQFMAEQGYTQELSQVLATNSVIEEHLLPSFVHLQYRTKFIRYTRLHAAAFIGNVDRVRKLVESGADLEASTITGYTPLTFAIMQKNFEVANLLLEKGASPHGSERSPDPPVFWACRRHDHALLMLLQRYKVDLDAPFSKWAPATPITYAVEHGDSVLLHMLLEEGCDPDCPDGNGGTALWYAQKVKVWRITKMLKAYSATVVQPPEIERQRIEEQERQAALQREKEEAMRQEMIAAGLLNSAGEPIEGRTGTSQQKTGAEGAEESEEGENLDNGQSAGPPQVRDVGAMSQLDLRAEAARLGLIRLTKEDLAAQKAAHDASVAASAAAERDRYRNMSKKKNAPKVAVAVAPKKVKKEKRK